MQIPSMLRRTLAVVVLGAITVPLAADDGFRPLFNGENLDGWTTEGNWQVRDGVLVIEPRPGEEGWRRFEDYLWTEKKYGDFVLSVEFKIPPDGNSGVFVRVRDREDPVEQGIEAQINDVHEKEGDLSAHDCGGIISAAAPSKNMARPAGEWNRMVVTCEGDRIKVALNGEQVVDLALEDSPLADRPSVGYVGLQDHGLPLKYRNIRIKELD